MRDGAAGDAVADVKVGVAVFELEIRRIENVVEVGEGALVLVVVCGVGVGVGASEVERA
jgi:hypothetical protein